MSATPDHEEDYHSASDEDFNPVAEPEASDISSSSEDEAERVKKPKRKPKRQADDALDSGDEVTIQELRTKRQKGDEDVYFSDDGGEGGLVKTRAQRAKEVKEYRPLARIDGATADVDAIWAMLQNKPLGRPPDPTSQQEPDITSPQKGIEIPVAKPATTEFEEEYITIKRTYKFAGETHNEEKRVLKSSEEARLYLASQKDKVQKDKENDEPIEDKENEEEEPKDNKPKLRRPLKRPSRFEPNPHGEVRGLPPELQLRWPRTKASATAHSALQATDAKKAKPLTKPAAATKLNTVDKSRFDWAGYVDQEGIADELDEYGRSKGAYGGRMEFLQRVEQRKEDERRVAKS